MDEFLKAWNALVVTPVQEIEFRVYYDSVSGDVLDYTNDRKPGDYILVDKETFHQNRFDRKVKNGKLISLQPVIGKLRPSVTGTPCHCNDITIITDDIEQAIFWKNYTYDND
jgi:hypothetical protein